MRRQTITHRTKLESASQMLNTGERGESRHRKRCGEKRDHNRRFCSATFSFQNLKRTEKLKGFHSEHPETKHLDSTVYFILDLALSHTSPPHPSTHVRHLLICYMAK